MKKLFGILFSLIGNIGVMVFFVLGLLTLVLGFLSNNADLTLPIVLGVLMLVSELMAGAGDKLEDKHNEAGLKAKYVFMGFPLIVFNPFVYILISVSGFLVLAYGLLGVFNMFEMDPNQSTLFTAIGVYGMVGGAIVSRFATYRETHCKHCGASLKGAAYEYEEIEREYSVGNDNKLHRKSRVEFTFYCNECEQEIVRYKKLSTDKKTIDGYARSVVGRKR